MTRNQMKVCILTYLKPSYKENFLKILAICNVRLRNSTSEGFLSLKLIKGHDDKK